MKLFEIRVQTLDRTLVDKVFAFVIMQYQKVLRTIEHFYTPFN